MILWITGNRGSGKTTLAKKIVAADNRTILLDGDAMRTCWTLGLTKEDRWEQNMRIARLAKVLDAQGFNIVVATICPFRELREDIRKLTTCRFVYLDGGQEPSEEHPYEKDQ